MSTLLGSARRLVLTPSLNDVTFAKRGFPGASRHTASQLERIPQTVICGFEWGIDSRGLDEVYRRVDMIEPDLRGFAWEGAIMALTVRDAIAGHRTEEALRGPGQPHILVAYIGIGFAMARFPRRIWKKVMPDLTGTPFYPAITWLAVDGWAFDRAYFDTRRWVDEQYVPSPYPWQGYPEYFHRASDQGIGRALWFIHGGSIEDTAAAIGKFAESRHADLWSGVGVAATYAGGCEEDELPDLIKASGEHRLEVGLGVVFGVKARDLAGFVPEHTKAAAAAFDGLTVAEAVAMADAGSALGLVDGPEPSYEMWRRHIRADLSH